jgi:hypothetical protein
LPANPPVHFGSLIFLKGQCRYKPLHFDSFFEFADCP